MALPNAAELTARIRAPFMSILGLADRFAKRGWDNDYIQRSFNAAGTDQIMSGSGTDALDNRLLGGGYYRPFATPIRLNISANAKIGQTTQFFANANDTTPLEIVQISCIFGTADGATNTGYVSKETQGQPAPGATCMSGTFNLNATANTLQTATLAGATGTPSLVLNAGEQLTFNIASAVTSLASLEVIVWVRPHTGLPFAQFVRPANGDIATSTIYLNIVPGTVVRAVSMRWSTAATNAGTVTMDVTKDTSTTAPGAGTSILAAAQSVKGAAHTTVFPALAASSATLTMAVGDRLAVKTAGTLTALAGLVITVFFSAGPEDHIVVPVTLWDANSTDRTLFIANHHYVVADAWETWSTVSTSLTQLLTKDTGTTAPGAGTGLQTDNSAAGILTSGTINTPVGSLLLSAVSTKPTLWLAPGDRLGLKNAGTAASVAGVSISVLLRRV
jgi:hypothetical protein